MQESTGDVLPPLPPAPVIVPGLGSVALSSVIDHTRAEGPSVLTAVTAPSRAPAISEPAGIVRFLHCPSSPSTYTTGEDGVIFTGSPYPNSI
ncbi:hypothetical protein A5728_02920 [Kocuria sp. ICS0012]|nr:hypothetical protein A5728_02920 [Kocuria sp. ICS0012]